MLQKNKAKVPILFSYSESMKLLFQNWALIQMIKVLVKIFTETKIP